MKVALLVAFLPAALQDAALDEAAVRDRARIAAKVPLTEAERRGYAEPAAPAVEAKRTAYRLGVVRLTLGGAGPTRELDADLASVRDFYAEASSKAFGLETLDAGAIGLELARDALDAWPVGGADEKRAIVEAVGALRNRIGEEAFGKLDGVAFVAPGGVGRRERALWPHQDAVELSDRRLGYLILPEEAGGRWVGITAHEFGHLLGLEDKYEVDGANAGPWCLMGTGYLGDKQKRPLPLCAVCRASLGWTGLAELDAREPHAVRLSPGVAVRVSLTSDGKEALVVEARSEGRLAIWHLGGGKPVELRCVLPSEAADRFTPLSDPALRGRQLGARSLWVTDVRAESGAAWFLVAPEAEPTELERVRRSRVGHRLGAGEKSETGGKER